MATKTITDLTAATALDSDDVFAVDEDGVTVKATTTQVAAGVAGVGVVAQDAVFDAKGDLVVGTGANTASRLAVGTNDYVLTADSAQATGLKWAAAAGGVTWPLAGDADAVGAPNYSWSGDTTTGMYRIGASNIGIALGGTKYLDLSTSLTTVTTATKINPASSWASGGDPMLLVGPATLTPSSASNFVVVDIGQSTQGIQPTTTTAPASVTALRTTLLAQQGSLGATAYPSLYGIYNDVNVQQTATTGTSFYTSVTNVVTTLTDAYGIEVNLGNGFGGTMTTGHVFYCDNNGGTTAWGIQLGNFQSQHMGKLGLGGSTISTPPTYGLHLFNTAQDLGAVHLPESAATPTNPASSAGVVMYHKSDRIIFAFNDAGTMRYKSLLLTGTGTTWSHATTGP